MIDRICAIRCVVLHLRSVISLVEFRRQSVRKTKTMTTLASKELLYGEYINPTVENKLTTIYYDIHEKYFCSSFSTDRFVVA